MKTTQKKFRAIKKKAGFTLIELLVVIAIIGLLATVAVVALSKARENSRDSKRIGDVKQINTALQLYYSKSVDFKYPGSEDEEPQAISGYLYDSSCRMSTHSDEFIPGLNNLNPQIMPVRPDEPLDSRLSDDGYYCYLYILSDDYKHYYLMAELEDTSKAQKCNIPDTAPAPIRVLNNRSGRYCFQSDYQP